MAPDSLSLGSYEHHGHHHHHLLPQQQTNTAALPSTLADSFQPRRSETSNLQGSSSGGPCMTPTWRGFVHSTGDALKILEACLVGKLHHIPRRPHDRERSHIIVSGNVFIYEENASGIKRWTDGVTWSPSRIMGNFLVYRELSEPFPAGEKKKAKKRKRGSEEVEPVSHLGAHSEEDRKLVGSLVDSYGFKPDGLIKKTLNVKYKGVNHHIVSYYTLEDVKQGTYTRPGFDHKLMDIHPRDELTTQRFKVSVHDADDDLLAAAIDPYHGQPVMPIQNGNMYTQPPSLHVYTSGQALAPSHETSFAQMSNSAISQSPHATISADCTPVDYYQYTYNQPSSQYFGPSMVDGHALCHSRGDERVDSVIEAHQAAPHFFGSGVVDGHSHGHSHGDERVDSVVGSQPHFKSGISEMTELPEMPVFSSAGSDNAPITPLSHFQPLASSTDPFAVHSAGPIYDNIDESANWSLSASAYHEPLSMPAPKRRQTAPIMTLSHLSPSLANSLMNYNQHMHHFTPSLTEGGG